ncbi:hypothetical protein K2Z84_29095 [Candidatus Binatia bacterium]|nr:hypothetical protein [Candidatus Binatia bacterium]
MSVDIPSGGPAPEAFMDSALLHGAVSAFYRSPVEMTEWERYSLAMTTLGLWFHRGLRIQAGTYEGKSAVEYALRELGAVRAQPTKSDIYDECVQTTSDWVRSNISDVRQSLATMQADPSYPCWMEWSVKHAWGEHRQRFGGLIDASMVGALRLILDLPSLEAAQRLLADAQNLTYVNQWIAGGVAAAPEEVVKGYCASALLRGVVNHEVRCREGTQYAFHPFRRAILPTGTASGEAAVPQTARWLASMILNAAFQCSDIQERAVCWAQNVTRVRLAIGAREQPLEFDHDLVGAQAANRAAAIVKQLELTMPSRIIEIGTEFLFGTFEVIGIAEYILKLKGWRVPSKAVSEKLSRTSRHLTDLGRQSPGQIVFLTGSMSLSPGEVHLGVDVKGD